MTENDFILFDRIEIIKKTIEKYGEENFYISFSGGKDSTVLHHLIDEAIPGNKIPRVFMNTGIEYNDIRRFVEELTEKDLDEFEKEFGFKLLPTGFKKPLSEITKEEYRERIEYLYNAIINDDSNEEEENA